MWIWYSISWYTDIYFNLKLLISFLQNLWSNLLLQEDSVYFYSLYGSCCGLTEWPLKAHVVEVWSPTDGPVGRWWRLRCGGIQVSSIQSCWSQWSSNVGFPRCRVWSKDLVVRDLLTESLRRRAAKEEGWVWELSKDVASGKASHSLNLEVLGPESYTEWSHLRPGSGRVSMSASGWLWAAGKRDGNSERWFLFIPG